MAFDLSDFLSGLLGTGLNLEGVRKMQGALGQFGEQAYTGLTDIGREAQAATEFRPFTVTTGLGGVQATGGQPLTDPATGQPVIDPNTGQPIMTGFGGVTTTLTPEQQALASGLQAGATGLMGTATARPTAYDPLSASALGQAQTTLGSVGSPDLAMALQRAGVGTLFGQQLGQIGLPTGLENLTREALTKGQQRIEGAAAPSDLAALQQQYAGLAGTAAGGLLQPRGEREQDIYSKLRAVQTPEEERQRLALEQRLASQGRLGVQTAQFGGTPEQFALAKAQEEAQNQAALMALQQAGTEEQQAYQQALGLAGQTGQLAQLGSGLESQALQRGMGLSQLGLAGTQAGSGLEAQRLQQLLGLQQADIGAAGAQQALQQGQLGLAGGLFDISRTAAGLPSQLQAGDIANLQALMQTSYAPQAQLLNALQPAINLANIASTGQRQGAGLFSESAASGLQAQLQSALQAAQLEQGLFQSVANLVGGQGNQGGLFTGIFDAIENPIEEWFKGLFT
jgi:hypothetical protein